MRTYDHTRPADLDNRPTPEPGPFFSTRRAMETLIYGDDEETILDRLRRIMYLDLHGGEQ